MADIFTKRVAANPDDGNIYYTGATWKFSYSTTDNPIGHSSAAMYKRSLFARFTNVTVPKDATILAAKLTFVSHFSYSETTVNVRIQAAAQDNPDTITTASDYRNRPKTEAVIDWDDIPPWTAEQEFDTPDIKAAIQEVVNRENWQSGSAMLLFVHDLDDRTSHVSNCIRTPYDYVGGTTKAALLTIEWTTAPPAPEIQTQDATNIKSDQADLATKVIDDKGKTLSVRHNYGKTIAYGMNTPWQEGKHTNDIITQTVINLDPETEYHFRGEAVYED